MASEALAVAIGRPVELEPLPPLLLEALRWSTPYSARASCEGMAQEALIRAGGSRESLTSLTPAALFKTLLALSETQLLDLDLEAVLVTLEVARSTIPCITTPLARADIRQLFLQEAITLFYLSDARYVQAIGDVLAVDPVLDIDADYPPRVLNAIIETSRKYAHIQPIILARDDERGELLIDGVGADTHGEIRPGRHVFQLAGPHGGFRSALVAIGPSATGQPEELELSNLVDFSLPSLQSVNAELVHGLRELHLTSLQRASLEEYLMGGGPDSILFAVTSPVRAGPMLVEYRRGGGVQEYWGGTARIRSRPTGKSPFRGSPHAPPHARRGDHAGDERPGLEAGVGLGIQRVKGSNSALLVNGWSAGISLMVSYPLEQAILEARLSHFPMQLGDVAPDWDESAPNVPSRATVVAAAEILPKQSQYGAGLGVSHRWTLARRLILQPALYLDGAYLPNLLVFAEEIEPVTPMLARGVMLGPVARLRFDQVVPVGGIVLRTSLEISGGTLLGALNGKLKAVFPLGASLQAAMQF